MKTTNVRGLRNEFRRLSRWIEAGETVQITKRGKPFAQITRSLPRYPPLLDRMSLGPGSWLGRLAGTTKIPHDIDDPVPVEWEAMK